ncbi:ACP S-malonyltransferase [Streptomyces sp. NPDC002078]
MTEIWMFPGQGGQRVGMAADWWDAAPEPVAAADTVLGCSVSDLCANGPREQLDDTRYAQPALYVVGSVAWRATLAAGAPPPDVVCGHSLGEYNALEHAGAMEFTGGLRLVRRRAEAMAAFPVPQLRDFADILTTSRVCEARPLRVSGAFRTTARCGHCWTCPSRASAGSAVAPR